MLQPLVAFNPITNHPHRVFSRYHSSRILQWLSLNKNSMNKVLEHAYLRNDTQRVVQSSASLYSEQLYLPYLKISPSSDICLSSNQYIVFAHGLGPKNPRTKSHLNDDWGALVYEAVKDLQVSYLTYTARGHGNSSGWETTAAADPEQFTWKRLANDMHEVSKSVDATGIIATGSSMGSATALYAAIHFPEFVKGVILIRPPTAWAARSERRKFLLSSANKVKAEEVDSKTNYHLVLEGTAYSDLPSPELEQELYASIRCPVLILTIEGDDAHPVSTAETLHRLISTSRLIVSTSKDEAMSSWKEIISSFTKEILESR
jgi:3-oxoadipate enol-lactonase